jgi:hypothetical protein
MDPICAEHDCILHPFVRMLATSAAEIGRLAMPLTTSASRAGLNRPVLDYPPYVKVGIAFRASLLAPGIVIFVWSLSASR